MSTVPITTCVVNSNPAHGEVCSIHNIMWSSSSATFGMSVVFIPNKTDRHYITEILLKVALSTITPNAGRMENLNIENLKRQKHAKSYSSELSKPF